MAYLVYPGGEGLGGALVMIGICEGAHGVYEFAYAQTGEGRAGEYGENVPFFYLAHESGSEFCRVGVAFQHQLQHFLVPFSDGFAELIGNDAGCIAVHGHCVGGEARAYLRKHRRLVRTRAVDLVYEYEHGHVMLLQQLPHGLGMALHAFCAADHHYGIVHSGYGALHFGGKVHMTGSVQPIICIAVPLKYRLIGKNGYAAAFFYWMGVEERVFMVNAAGGAQRAGEEQHLFRKCGLACVDVGKYADGLFHIISPIIQKAGRRVPARMCGGIMPR